MQQVTIYTDGGYRNSQKIGSWGYTATCNGVTRERAQFVMNTTNNVMELTAVCEALEMLSEPCDVTVFSDSMYVINGLTKWCAGWKKNKWLTRQGTPVKNIDSWKRIMEASAKHTLEMIHVKAHNGDIGNERADTLCGLAMDQA